MPYTSWFGLSQVENIILKISDSCRSGMTSSTGAIETAQKKILARRRRGYRNR